MSVFKKLFSFLEVLYNTWLYISGNSEISSLQYISCGIVCVAVSPPKAYCLICTLVSCFKEVLSVAMLCTPMFIFTSGSSAILGRPFCGLSI